MDAWLIAAEAYYTARASFARERTLEELETAMLLAWLQIPPNERASALSAASERGIRAR